MSQQSYNSNANATALSSSDGTAVLKFPLRKAIAFVDGSNWYHKLRKLLNSEKSAEQTFKNPSVNFDLRHFIESLITSENLTEIRYYIGQVKKTRGDGKTERMYAGQQRLIEALKHQQVNINFGHLITYPDGSFHEKGVDILLAVEMIRFALEKKYDVAYLVSSDTDLVPAVQECRRHGSEVVYVGSSLHGQSFGLSKICNRTILLQPKDVLPFLPPKIDATEARHS